MDFAFASAKDVDVTNAIDSFQNRLNLVFNEFTQLHRIQIRRTSQQRHRRGRRVEFHQSRTIDVIWQSIDNTVDTIANIVCGRIDVRSPFERHTNGRTAFGRTRTNLLHARNGADALFDWTRHKFLNIFRARVFICRGYSHGRKRDIRHHIDR